jgi:hypothetical protein
MVNRNLTIAAAVTAALGAASAHGQTTVTLTQFGSSAVLPIIEQVWHDYCTAGTLNEYRDATAQTAAAYAAGGGSYRIYTCTIGTKPAATTAGINGYVLTYYERGTGGSVYGVNPVAQSTGTFGRMNTTNCAAQGAVNGINTFACFPVTTEAAVPDIGISDVEPAMFYGSNVNLPSTFTQLNSTDQAKLSSTPFIQQVFGVAVSSNLKSSITNLTASQISSIFAGTYTDWHSLNSSIAAGTTIHICARTAGSGTQAGANAIFLQNPCSPAGQIAFATTNVTLNASTGNVLSCLDSTANAIGIAGLADGPRAASGTFTGDGFGFISIDGQAPSAANAAQGGYVYEVESTINTRNSGYTTAQNNVIGALGGIFSDPASLSTVNSGLPQAAVNALSLNYTPTTPYAASNPVEWGSRGGSTCSPYQLTFP